MEIKEDSTAIFDDGTKGWWMLKETEGGIVHLGLVLPAEKTPQIFLVCKDKLIDETKACFLGEVPDKNKFNATSDEYLAAASTYFEKESNWELSVYVNGVLNRKQVSEYECNTMESYSMCLPMSLRVYQGERRIIKEIYMEYRQSYEWRYCYCALW